MTPIPGQVLLHIVSTAAWSGAPQTGGYESPTLASAGFIHLSTPEQVHIPANNLYAGREDLLLLCVEEDRLTSAVTYEPGVPDHPESMLFPHLFGPLDLAAVYAVVSYRPDDTGVFRPPTDLPAS